MKHLIDRLQIAQGNNNVEELIPEAIEMLRQQQARNKLLTDVLIETNTFVRELRAENEALKKQKQHYDQWLKNGVYFTKEEYKDFVRQQQAENEELKDKLNLANKQIEILGDWIK